MKRQKAEERPQTANARRAKNEALSRQPRIRRGDEVPYFVQEEAASRRAYRNSVEFTFKGYRGRMQYWRSRWSRNDGEILSRSLFCWVVLRRKRMAALELIEFEPPPSLTNNNFFDSMDAVSQIDCDLAMVLCSAWSQFCRQVILYGSLVDFRMAWADPASPPGLWAAAAEELIAWEFRNYSLLTMKAYPLEYEGRVPEGSAAQTGLLARQRAMIRYYQRLFGVQKFPGWSGEQGWLYRLNPVLEPIMERPDALAFPRGFLDLM